jgi:hypothetical protein
MNTEMNTNSHTDVNPNVSTEMKEKLCGHSLIYRQEEKFVSGDLDAAEKAAEDFIKSVRELRKIQRLNRIKLVVGDNVERVARV